MIVLYNLQALLLLACSFPGGLSELSNYSNCFSLKLYKKLAEANTNLISSPFSADILLSLLMTASGGNTATQLKNVLSYSDDPNFTLTDLKTSFKAALNSIVSSNGNSLSIANSVWFQNSFSVNPDFASTAKEYFNADSESIDFAGNPDQATDTINNWASTNTNGLIPKIFDKALPRNTLLLLANALYFKGNWAKKFESFNTYNQPFFNNGDESNISSVPLMNQLQRFPYRFSQELNSQILELEYEGKGTSMFIILPDKSSSLKNLEQTIDCEKLADSFSNLLNTEVQVTMPKFSVQSDLDLKDPLTNLGITDLFDAQGANLAGLVEGSSGSVPNLSVGDVAQKAVIDVDENGSVAAAVSDVRVCRSCTAIEEPERPIFRADRPFLYFIRHRKTGHILFIGRVSSL